MNKTRRMNVLILGAMSILVLLLSNSCKNDFLEYNPISNSWFQKADIPVARCSAFCEVENNKAYLGTGQGDNHYKNDLYEYNPGTNSWKSLSNCPFGKRTGVFTCVINSKIYITNGYDYSSGHIYYNDLWQYDPSLNSWTQLKDTSNNGVRFSENGLLYFGLGRGNQGAEDKMWRYNPELNEIRFKQELSNCYKSLNNFLECYFELENSIRKWLKKYKVTDINLKDKPLNLKYYP